jgi:hypothetical protein
LGHEFHTWSLAQMFCSVKSHSHQERRKGGFLPAASSGVSAA